jgi:hypothetical protein
MQMLWLGVAIAGTVGYHVILMLTPAGANPYLSLSISFAIGAVVVATTFAVAPGAPPRESISRLNWTGVLRGEADAGQCRRDRVVRRRVVADQPEVMGIFPTMPLRRADRPRATRGC